MVAHALARMLQTDEQFRDVTIATSGEKALRLAIDERPDVVLMDVRLPGRSGFEIAEEIRHRVPNARILFMSGDAPDLHVQLAIRCKAAGLLLKGCSLDFLLDAIRRVAEGHNIFSPEIASRLEPDHETGMLRCKQDPRLASLTARQLEVLRHLASGLTLKETASCLHLSVKTVDSHASRLMKVLGVHSRVELARLAIREGLVNA
jgi:DNA-binding NarL/FixJ family response regulator